MRTFQANRKVDEHTIVKIYWSNYIQSGYNKNHLEKSKTFGQCPHILWCYHINIFQIGG